MADPQKPIELSDIGEKGPGFLINHSDPAGVPRPDVWRQAVADFYQLDLDASALWSQIGPSPLIVNGDPLHMGIGPDAGEVTDIVIDPSGAADQTIYISSDDGGVWKTGDAGNTWTALTDQMFSLSMGAIAMDPANPKILYGGSGNLFDGGAAFTKGAGIYRSADAGSTWSIVDGGYFGTLFANIGINRMVCPAPDTLLVATNQGLYRSADGGRNFGANPPNFNDRQPVVPGIISCLLLDSATPASTVYCGVAGHSVDASGNPLPNRGLLKSINAGITFPTNLFTDPTAPQLPYRRFLVAQSQFDGTTANSAVLYASVQSSLANGAPTYIGLFRSDDSGSTWTPLPSLFAVASRNVPSDAIGTGFTQTNYDLTLGVDPLNPLRVYAGFQQLWLSIDGGGSFQPQAVTASQGSLGQPRHRLQPLRASPRRRTHPALHRHRWRHRRQQQRRRCLELDQRQPRHQSVSRNRHRQRRDRHSAAQRLHLRRLPGHRHVGPSPHHRRRPPVACRHQRRRLARRRRSLRPHHRLRLRR